jgi:hypothetical protein
MYSRVLDNFWNKPTYKHPYYYIHNVNDVDNTIIEDNLAAKTAGHTSVYTKTSLPTDTKTLGKNSASEGVTTW